MDNKIYISRSEANAMRNNCISEFTGDTEWDSFVRHYELEGKEVVEIADEEDY
jgi:hypothetical protein